MQKNLYFIHGWGMHSAVWQPIAKYFDDTFNVHLIDLPGYGRQANHCPSDYSLNSISRLVAEQITSPGILIGWSLGGLVAQHIALEYDCCEALIAVATSPCFSSQNNWPGIDAQVLNNFATMLEADAKKTLERFIAIQAIGSEHARHDIKALVELLAAAPAANQTALTGGLDILKTADLRTQISGICCPTLRLYGRLDSLVPSKAVTMIQNQQPNCVTQVISKAAHAPFISHPDEFKQRVLNFMQTLN
ncbi:pimeloyl-ACP methyl ester esterase BioH [Gayadomonas joobiniege]|uniref:pimeloyl-ACP methyl ester esterase BioH n=1 Tax=Gayadomonas joobiniege TaxID=1234606 RepID=UPI00037B21CA|nr:pimeloyl-ACP methyl ester esterase BioH [Gayadomonas joobiniege]